MGCVRRYLGQSLSILSLVVPVFRGLCVKIADSIQFDCGLIRVWTHFSQHLIVKSCTIDKKLMAFFSNLVASLRISFILQKKRSTILRMA